jgi:hypothetical protein
MNNTQGNLMPNNASSGANKTVLICAPPYQNYSAGIVILHELCDAIVRLGYVAHIILMDSSTGKWSFHVSEDPSFYGAGLQRAAVPPDLGEKWIRQVLDTGITIYPEIIVGNPLNAKNVVRYFLNGDGVITGNKSEYQPNDFCLAFSKMFFEKPNAILYKPIRSPLFNDVNTKPFHNRSLDLTYFGKGPNYVSCFRIEDSVILPRDWPKTKSELAVLLRNTRYLYCWDTVTSTITDAVSCGAKVVLLQFIQADEEKLRQGEWGQIPYIKGKFDGPTLTLIDSPDYDHVRNRFLEKLNKYEREWLTNVSLTLTSIFGYFGIVEK